MHAARSVRALAVSIATFAGAAAAHADGWATLTPIPVGRYNAAAVALNGRIYVFGGFTSLGASSDCYSYCEEDSTWLALAAMLAPRYNGVGVETEGTIYQIGGFSAPN